LTDPSIDLLQDTVEQRILDLQEKKKRLADASLGEGTGAKVSSTIPFSSSGFAKLATRLFVSFFDFSIADLFSHKPFFLRWEDCLLGIWLSW